jgi:hypothetical protein
LDRVLADLVDRPYGVVVVDSTTRLVNLYGGNSQNEDDVTNIVHSTLQPIADAGSAVILIDHTTKTGSTDDPAGGAAKLRVIGGIAIAVGVQRTLVKGCGGALTLRGRKDRHGGVASHCPPPTGGGLLFDIGTFVLDPVNPDTGVAPWCVECPRPVHATAATPGHPSSDPHAAAANRLREFTVRTLTVAANDLPDVVVLEQYRPAKSQTERWIRQHVASGQIVEIPDSAPKRWRVAE